MPITTPHTALLDLQESVYSVLTTTNAFTSICTGIFDPAPENQKFPYCTFGEHIESEWYQFGNTGRMVLFIIHVWSQIPSFEEALNILNVIVATLETQTLTLTNFNMVKNGLLLDSTMKLNDPDGLTRHLVVRFRTWLAAK